MHGVFAIWNKNVWNDLKRSELDRPQFHESQYSEYRTSGVAFNTSLRRKTACAQMEEGEEVAMMQITM